MGRKTGGAHDDHDDGQIPPPRKSRGPGSKSATPPPRSGGRTTTPQPGVVGESSPAVVARRQQTGVTVTKERLETADRVYHRILWDTRLDPANFDLGYEDRFKGILFMPVRKFRNTGDDTSEIPFHRVYYFRYKGRIVWDRVNRRDLLDTLYESEGTTVVAASLLASVRDQSKLDVLGPEAPPDAPDAAADSEGVADAAAAAPSPPSLSVATFNVLFDLFDGDKIHTSHRIPLIARELEAVDADVIGLQEITVDIFNALRAKSPLLRQRYYWTTLPRDCKAVQVILSKHPISEAVSAVMSRNKRCIYAVVNVNLCPIVVANCHLISDYGGEASVDRRINELRTIFLAMAPHRRAVVLGDFNFGDENSEQTAVEWFDFADCHLSTVPSVRESPGFTFDLTRNPLAELSSKHHRYPRRLDRILVRGFEATSCAIFADRPTLVAIAKHPDPVTLFPSDHFGVVASLRIDESAMGGLCGDAPAAGGGASDGVTAAEAALSAAGLMLAPSANDFFPFFRSALVIIPPQGLHPAIDAFRDGRDKSFPRWMPHITLLFPFVHPTKYPQAIELIEAALSRSTVKPFAVELRKVGHFNAKKPVVFLAPEAEEKELLGLHALLQPLFPGCGRQEGPFEPHLTLGQVDRAALTAFTAQVKESWTPTSFTVSSLHIIAHLEDREGYEVMHTFSLDRDAARAGTGGGGGGGGGAELPLALDLGDMIMEDPQWGSRKIAPYIPKDPLEMWMLKVSVREYARQAPTHISQKGGMYHVPSELIDQYLDRWKEAIEQSEDTPFFVEEVRGDPFRLYLDIDVKRTVEVPFDASSLISMVCRFAKEMFPKAEVTCLSLECHGEWKDPHDPSVRFKSGFRIYFQRIFVTTEVYRRFLRRLAHWCRSNITDGIPCMPENTMWEDIVDQQCAEWERGRLLGTIKRRKSLQRIYTFHGMYNDAGRLEEVTATFGTDLRRVMFGQTLRLWNMLPSAPGVLQDNQFLLERLYTRLEGLHLTPDESQAEAEGAAAAAAASGVGGAKGKR